MPTLSETARRVQNREISAEKTVEEALGRIDAAKGLNAYISILPEFALERARAVDARVAAGEKVGPLAGVPVAVKDNIVVAAGKTTCGSRILENFHSPYDATVVARLLAAGAIPVGKTNLDEFAMGSTSETSAFGPPVNPLDASLTPGGSSGGSAVAVASGTVPVSLGSDTGGSIRQPAACCGIVGLKPTYGRVSRYGLVAYASSLDQVGPFANNVADAALLLNAIAGYDARDNTSSNRAAEDFTSQLGGGLKGKVIGVPKEAFGEGLHAGVESSVRAALAACEREGAKLVEIDLPALRFAVAAYYVIATAEASANLSRYDGVRYTRRAKDPKNLYELYAKSRSEGFGAEVKKRILLGTYVLSSGFYDAYYMQAQKARRVITDDFAKAFLGCDVIAMPTMPAPPPKVGDVFKDPMAIYLQDIYTVGVNLAGLPAISLPVAPAAGAPVGLQLVGRAFAETELFQVAAGAERAVG
ncbi:MAG TPA: Asp-tRNA(Asn)/Glu-tRNA(Gln) amidotransferase subunit GatA [Fibrobacteria bacterium]|jgi:aspartyl-tRNA(Asn)/glutamyl-tRNA(Gln) amidotransferase subunit A|nr:Asp-tRNA(Asn)/Glu-tRNA(Gln) amidotransferase subunit GatA [Fibrobacteria bacterium]